MIKIILLAFSVGLCPAAISQSFPTLIGARANALAYASTCLEDEWAIFNNIAGLAKLETSTASFTYEAVPRFIPFNRMAAVVAIPFTAGVAGFGAYRMGDALYNEHMISAAFSNTFGLAALGLKLNYVQYSAAGFGTKRVLSVSAGGIASITSTFSIGACIINMNQPALSKEEQEKLPTVLITGIAFKPNDKVFVTTEVEKDLRYDACWKTGLEYRAHKKVIFRTGFKIGPDAGYLGLGFRPTKFTLDYAYSYYAHMNAQHQATVGYKFLKKRTSSSAISP